MGNRYTLSQLIILGMHPVDTSQLTKANVLDILSYTDGTTLENLSFTHPWLEGLVERHRQQLPTHVITSLELVLGAKFPFLQRRRFTIGQLFDNIKEIMNFTNGLRLIYQEYVYVYPVKVSTMSISDEFYFCYTFLKQPDSQWKDLDPSDICVILKGTEADPYMKLIEME